MPNRGYIKIWRKLRDNPYLRKPAYLSIFFWMLMEAEHGMIKKDGKWRKKTSGEYKQIIFNGNRIELRAGQFTAGAKQLADWSGVPRGTVERIVKCFQNEEMIEVQRSNKFSLYTVKNWNRYQMVEEQNEEQMRNKRGTSEEQVRTPEECKPLKALKDTNVSETKVSYGNENINFIIDTLKSALDTHTLDGTAKVNRFAASNLWKRVMKETENNEDKSREVISVCIRKATSDNWHKSKATNVQYIYKNFLTLYQL